MKLLLQTNFLVLLALLFVVLEVECELPIFNKTNIQEPYLVHKSIRERLTDARETYLAGSSILYGLLKKLNESYVTDICKEHLQVLYNGINQKEVWAMKVLDSSAQLQSGFIFGNNFLLGSLRQCESFKEPHTVTLSKRFLRNMKTNLVETVGPFDLEYNVVYAIHDSPWQIQADVDLSMKILQVGLCLPKSCISVDVSNITQSYLNEETFGFASIYESQSKVLRVKTLEVKTNYFKKTSVQLMGAFVFITLLLTMMSHIIERDSENSACDVMGNGDSMNGHIKPTIPKKSSLLAGFLKCYSIKDNSKFIFSTTSSPDSLPSVSALKSIGSFLTVLGHTSYHSFYSVHNPVMAFAYHEQYPFIKTLSFIMEIFFTISGLQLSYNFLKNQRHIILIRTNSFRQNLILFTKVVLHRYFRLTPLYFFVIGLTEISFAYLHETSPFWIKFRFDLTCPSNLWRNLFYIQNLYGRGETCLTWTWSLDCEVQFFIFFTLLLFAYAKNPELTKKVFIALFGAFTLISYYVAYKAKIGLTLDVMTYIMDEVHTPPWMRIMPYFIGVGCGWVLLNFEHILNKKPTKFLYLVAVLIIILYHRGKVDREMSYGYAAVFFTVTRIVYPLSIALIIIANASKNLMPIAKLLNRKIFVHLNKLSYGIFLLHPLVIALVYGLRDHSNHFNASTLHVMSIGIFLITYLLALVCSLLFEAPYIKLSSLLQNYKRNKTL